jgi:hypothetical protein
VLGAEAVVHHTQAPRCGRWLEKFPRIVVEAKSILVRCEGGPERHGSVLDRRRKTGATPRSGAGREDQSRWNRSEPATDALGSRGSDGLVAVTRRICGFGVGWSGPVTPQPNAPAYGPRPAAYELKKLRGKKMVRRMDHKRRYASMPKGLRAAADLVVLRNQVIQPCSPPRRNYGRREARRIPQRWIRTTIRFARPWAVCFKSLGWPHEYRQSSCRGLPSSA